MYIQEYMYMPCYSVSYKATYKRSNICIRTEILSTATQYLGSGNALVCLSGFVAFVSAVA